MDIEHLIMLVKDKDPIYNPKHPKHRDRNYISEVWRSIATELNANDSEVKAKWQNLRSNYMREKRKLRVLHSGMDAESCQKITWPYFKLLQFLDPTLQHKVTSGNVPDIYNVDQEIEEHMDLQQEELQEESQLESQLETQDLQQSSEGRSQQESSKRSQEALQTRRNKRQKKSHDVEDDIDKQYLKHLRKISERGEDEKDADLLFLKSLLPSIKQLGTFENLEFKGEVINLLKKKLELKYTSASTPSTSNPPSVLTVDSAEEICENDINKLFVYIP